MNCTLHIVVPCVLPKSSIGRLGMAPNFGGSDVVKT